YFVIGLEKIKKEKLKLILIILIFSLYGIRTVLRNYDWKYPEKFYLKSIEYSFYPSLLYGNLSYYYLKNGDYEKSYQFAKNAIYIGLKNESILYVYGLSLLNKGMYSEAENVFNEILKINPQNYEVLTELAWLCYLKKDEKKAIELLNKSIEINENYPKIYYILAEIYRYKMDFEKFTVAVEKLSKLIPDDFYPYYLKGLIFRAIGDLTKSKENFQKAYKILKNKDDFYSLFNLGILLRELGKVEESLNLFKKLLNLKPDDFEILNEIGICYAVKGDNEKAKQIWTSILIKNPNYLPAKENLKKLSF
ncbi:MAG: tetratricopeptide repeat protein, partial [Candidatus Omnitrophica bacterium]|nr:tetratricopeptide repeat protein [Candidatus Omnitrophota bacterium]